MAKCSARQHSDQMVCHECGLVWDMNDPDPPPCPNLVPSATEKRPVGMYDKAINQIRKILKDK